MSDQGAKRVGLIHSLVAWACDATVSDGEWLSGMEKSVPILREMLHYREQLSARDVSLIQDFFCVE
jgi:hypothetical protein